MAPSQAATGGGGRKAGFRPRPASGAPCWVTLMTSDLSAARSFYATTLGWDYTPSGGTANGELVARRAGAPVAGVGTGNRARDQGAFWVPSFAVASANRTVERVLERGATIGVGPLGVDGGRAAWASDHEENLFTVWEGRAPTCWSNTEECGVWLELGAVDLFATALFYGGVFDWNRVRDGQLRVTFEGAALVLRVGGLTVARVATALEVEPARDSGVPEEERTLARGWYACFEVPDLDTTIERALAAGGDLLIPPGSDQLGRTRPDAVLRDPDGAMVGLLGPSRPSD